MLSSQWREMDSSSGKTERKGRKKKKKKKSRGEWTKGCFKELCA